MTLIVEAGMGLPDAESYASVAQADAYHAKRLNTAWAALAEPTKESLLIKATEYMVGQYRERWKGRRRTSTQALDWPRYDVEMDDVEAYLGADIVPVEVQNACAVLALQANSGDLAPALKRAIKEKVIGPIKTVYADGAPEFVRYRAVDQLLKPFLCGSGLTGRMVRS
jgi:hypothetical protein